MFVIFSIPAACEPYCLEPCAKLNGDVTSECDSCDADEYLCQPGAPGFETGVVANSPIPADSLSDCSQLENPTGFPRGRWGQSTHIYRAAGASPTWSHVKQRREALDCTQPSAMASLEPSCDDLEAMDERFAARGWTVLRGLAPKEELLKVVERTKAVANRTICQPMATETEEGRRACAYSSSAFRDDLPETWQRIHATLAEWERGDVAAGARLGKGLRLPPSFGRVARLIQVTTDAAFARVQEAAPTVRRYFADWHVDNHGSSGHHNFHWIWLMVDKQGDEHHGNLCLAATASVDQCDSPSARLHWLNTVPHRARHPHRKTSASAPGVGDTSHEALLDTIQCCPTLRPGDAVFYREDVAHRTQDELAVRLGMVIKVETDVPEAFTPEDVRCAAWAAEGHCATHEKFMHCVCRAACGEQSVSMREGTKDYADEL